MHRGIRTSGHTAAWPNTPSSSPPTSPPPSARVGGPGRVKSGFLAVIALFLTLSIMMELSFFTCFTKSCRQAKLTSLAPRGAEAGWAPRRVGGAGNSGSTSGHQNTAAPSQHPFHDLCGGTLPSAWPSTASLRRLTAVYLGLDKQPWRADNKNGHWGRLALKLLTTLPSWRFINELQITLRLPSVQRRLAAARFGVLKAKEAKDLSTAQVRAAVAATLSHFTISDNSWPAGPASGGSSSSDTSGAAQLLLDEYLSALLQLLWLPGGMRLLPAACRQQDRSLPMHIPVSPTNSSSARFFIAANLHNSRAVLPNWIAQLALLVTRLPAGSVAVSVFESGSTDDSAAWLAELRHLLELLEVPATIVTDGAVTQDSSLAEGGDRIPLMAQLRNAALQPLMQKTHGSFDRVAFINDVFFCADDIWRLASHGAADLACGLDFDAPPKPTYPDAPGWQDNVHGASSGKDFGAKMRFYDVWVARDVQGRRFSKLSPYVRHGPSAERLKSGFPIAVDCCFNGAVVMQAEPLLQHGLRFRSHQPGECAASECSLLCNDLHRLGYHAVVLDPGVRLVYEHQLAVPARTQQDTGLEWRSWQELQADGAAINNNLPLPQRPKRPQPSSVWGSRAWWEHKAAVLGLMETGQEREHDAAAAAESDDQHSGDADVGAQRHGMRSKLKPVPSGSIAANGSVEQFAALEEEMGWPQECCTLQPRQKYVNFQSDCMIIDLLGRNYTAAALMTQQNASGSSSHSTAGNM